MSKNKIKTAFNKAAFLQHQNNRTHKCECAAPHGHGHGHMHMHCMNMEHGQDMDMDMDMDMDTAHPHRTTVPAQKTQTHEMNYGTSFVASSDDHLIFF